jgi:predicted aconitase with swiveling domain
MKGRKTLSFKCHKIAGGSGAGKALISSDSICFYHTEPNTGIMIENNHALKGQNIANRVLIFPSGKGSSVVQGEGLYQLTKNGTGPKALIIQHPDTVLVVGAVIWKIPLVDQVEEEFYKHVENDAYVKVDADKGVITLIKGCS